MAPYMYVALDQATFHCFYHFGLYQGRIRSLHHAFEKVNLFEKPKLAAILDDVKWF